MEYRVWSIEKKPRGTAGMGERLRSGDPNQRETGDRMIGWAFNARSITSGFRSPFEFMYCGRAKHPCLAAADQGWSALPDRSPPPETIKALLTPQTLTLGVQVIGS